MELTKIILVTAFTFVSATLAFSFERDDRERFHREIDREKRDFEFDRKEINQAKFWDARLNKVITGIHGNRVRVEEFVTRPASNQVKFITLSKRKNRLDYMWFLQEFNKNLPKDIKGIALRCYWDYEPEFYPIKQTKFISNTQDSIKYLWENQRIEHIDTPDRDRPELEIWFIWPGRRSLTINGQLKEIIDFNNTDNMFPLGRPDYSGIKKYHDGGEWYLTTYPWDNNSFYKKERYFINDAGNKVEINYYSLDEVYKLQKDYNFEFIYTATEFENRTIDLIIVPRIFFKYVQGNDPFGDNPYFTW